MTGPTLLLTRQQREELVRFEDGQPHAPKERPNTNLIRRNFLMRVAPYGAGAYVITEAGKAALDLAVSSASGKGTG